MLVRVLGAMAFGITAVVAPQVTDSGAAGVTFHHMLVTGQSLSQGLESVPALSTTQANGHRMLAFDWVGSSRVYTSFGPLVEGGYPHDGETIASAWANATSELAGASFKAIVSRHGVSGYGYSQLAKGTAPYADGLAQVTKVQQLLIAEGNQQVVDAVGVIHGEADDVPYGQATGYAANLIQWQADYEADVRAITGQSQPVVLFTDQMGSYQPTSAIPFAQLQASRQAPGKVVLVGPKYFLDYVGNRHISNVSERLLGEYYAKAYDRVVIDGGTWTPLAPLGVTVCGTTVRARLHVPAGPLVIDTTTVNAAEDFGFEFVDGSANPPTIEAVSIVGPDTVELTLSSAPSAAPRLRYAFTAGIGEAQRARGNVRDSDATVGVTGTPLHNWLVHFDEAVGADCTVGSTTTLPPTTTTVPPTTTTVLPTTTTVLPTTTTVSPTTTLLPPTTTTVLPTTTTRPPTDSMALTVAVVGDRMQMSWTEPATGQPDSYRINTGLPTWGTWTQLGLYRSSLIDVAGAPDGTYTAVIQALVSGNVVEQASADFVLDRSSGPTTTTVPPTTTTVPPTTTTVPPTTTTVPPTTTTVPPTTTTRPPVVRNDTLSRAVAIAVPGSASVSTSGWIKDGRAPGCASVSGPSAWYRLSSPPVGRNVRVVTTGSAVDTVVAVWRNLNGVISRVRCNDNASASTTTSSLSVSIVSGATYYVQIASKPASGGLVALTTSRV